MGIVRIQKLTGPQKFKDDRIIYLIFSSFRILQNSLFVDLIFEKETPTIKKEGKIIGIDRGFNTMLVTSDNQFVGKELKETIKKGRQEKKELASAY